MKCVCFLFAWFSSMTGIAQSSLASHPSSYAAVGAISGSFSDVFSFSANQASLGRTKNFALGIYSERRFMLKELKRFSASLCVPLPQGGTGLTIDYAGFTAYNELHAGAAYGMKLGEKLDLGAQLNYYRIGMAAYGSAATVNVEMGAILHLTEKFHLGCHMFNPVGGKFGKNLVEKVPAIYSFGTGYDASEKLFLSAAMAKVEGQPINIDVAMHYAFVKQFFVRGGIMSASSGYFAGAGMLWKNYRLDIAAEWHPQLGFTPCLVLVFSPYKNKSQQE